MRDTSSKTLMVCGETQREISSLPSPSGGRGVYVGGGRPYGQVGTRSDSPLFFFFLLLSPSRYFTSETDPSWTWLRPFRWRLVGRMEKLPEQVTSTERKVHPEKEWWYRVCVCVCVPVPEISLMAAVSSYLMERWSGAAAREKDKAKDGDVDDSVSTGKE